MAKSIKVKPKKRGRPSKGGREPFIGIRLSPDLIKRIKQWGSDHESPSRSEAIRHLVEVGLKSSGYS
jgi:hypothetical protein